MVILEETGDSERTKAEGLFDLPAVARRLPARRAGIGLQVHKKDWRIQYPLDGELQVPALTTRERVEIRLLPLGSKKWWSDDRIEKFIADTADRAKEQIAAGEKERRMPDFGRYIKEWAIQYGFSADQAKAEIDRWVAETRRKQRTTSTSWAWPPLPRRISAGPIGSSWTRPAPTRNGCARPNGASENIVRRPPVITDWPVTPPTTTMPSTGRSTPMPGLGLSR